MGQLKTSVAHLEYENAQMKRDVTRLRRENRQLEQRLVMQEQDNGDLTARLDDARNLLRDRGIDAGERIEGGSREGSSEADGFRTLPAGQSNRKRRKAPFARIPGQFSPAAPERDQDADAEDEQGMLGPPQSAPGSGSGEDQVGLRLDDDIDHHSGYTGPLKWAPIAGRAGDPASRVR